MHPYSPATYRSRFSPGTGECGKSPVYGTSSGVSGSALLPIGVVAAGCDFFLLEKPVIGLSELFRLPSAISRFFLGISFAAVALISSVYTAIVLEKLPYIDNVFAGIRDYLSGLVAGFSGIGSSQDPFSGITAFFQTVADTNHVAGLDYRSMLFSMAAIIVPPLILALIS